MNDELLRKKIDSSNLSKSFIAECLGLSRQGLHNKLIGEREFKGSEIKKLSILLNLSDSERESIFFTDFVDESANIIKQRCERRPH